MRAHGKLKLGLAGLAAFAVVRASSVVLAQEADLHEFRAACTQDYKLYCTGDNPGVALEAACLRQYYVNLSLNCRTALDDLQNPTGAEDQIDSSGENSP